MPKRTDIHKILIIGSGPIVIGQACEFDYSGTQACKALRQEGYLVVLVVLVVGIVASSVLLAACTGAAEASMTTPSAAHIGSSTAIDAVLALMHPGRP